jgi:hypothetical protein
MRRENYQYWTIGHVIATGLIDPTSELPTKFSSVDDFVIFYRSRNVSMTLRHEVGLFSV